MGLREFAHITSRLGYTVGAEVRSLPSFHSHPDAWFTIGSQHMVCQDHAVAGISATTGAFAALADGCSSSPATDIGARLLTRAATLALRDAYDLPDVDAVVRTAARWASSQDLSPERPAPWCLDATLSMALARPDGSVQCLIAGDGAMAVRHRDGRVTTVSMRWDGNAPPYPSYRLHPSRRMGWQAQFGTGELHEWSSDGVQRQTLVHDEPRTWTFHAEDIDLILLMSDGVESFHGRHGETITPHDVATRLLSVQRSTGRYLVRRTRRFVTRECDSLSWWHADDLAVAGIALIEEALPPP